MSVTCEIHNKLLNAASPTFVFVKKISNSDQQHGGQDEVKIASNHVVEQLFQRSTASAH